VQGALRRYFHIAGYYLLLVGMAILFCLFPLWIWIGVGWILVMPAIFVENIGLGAALGRSWRLVQGRWWRTFLILFLMFILVEVVASALGAFLFLAQTLLQISIAVRNVQDPDRNAQSCPHPCSYGFIVDHVCNYVRVHMKLDTIPLRDIQMGVELMACEVIGGRREPSPQVMETGSLNSRPP